MQTFGVSFFVSLKYVEQTVEFPVNSDTMMLMHWTFIISLDNALVAMMVLSYHK